MTEKTPLWFQVVVSTFFVTVAVGLALLLLNVVSGGGLW